jgi:small subunit ribosomal protein S20
VYVDYKRATVCKTITEVNKMPNIKSAIKRVATNNAANERNSAQKAAMRTAVKKFETAVANGDDNAAELYKAASKAIDQAESKGLIHKNKASRDKSRLAAKLAK